MILTATRHPDLAVDLDSEALAWFEYLDTCRAVSKFSYDELEEWAWARLEERLGQISEGLAHEHSTA